MENKKEYFKNYHEKNKIKLNQRSSIYRKEHINEILEYKKKYYQDHKKECKKYQLKYYCSHHEKVEPRRKKSKKELSERRKEYRETYKEKIKIYNEIYREKNKEKIKEYHKKYHQIHKGKNKKQRKRYIREYQRIRCHNDVGFKLICNLRSRIWSALKGICKSKTTVKLIGCSVDQLKQHLENQFKSGMSWDNYGLWHVDHIRPCAIFDLSKPEEQLRCFHFSNLQPLWAIENLSKNKKVLGE